MSKEIIKKIGNIVVDHNEFCGITEYTSLDETKYWDSIEYALNEMLTSQPLEELKQEIIDELNELNIFNKWEWVDENEHKGFVVRNSDGNVSLYFGLQTSVEYKTCDLRTNAVLPIKSAHKITTYFLRLDQDNE